MVPHLAARPIASAEGIGKMLPGVSVVKRHRRGEALRFMNLIPGAIEGQRVAFGVCAEVEFGRDADARAAGRFPILLSLFTAAACWCARTIVESMACSAPAEGPRLAGISNAASLTPSLFPRAKRTRTEVQSRYSIGMPSQGALGRGTQTMPLTVRRLSFSGGPRSPRPGSKGSKMRYSMSVG